MADISKYPFFNHLRVDTTTYVQHVRNGREKHAGTGLAFWFRPRSAALVEIPLDDREQSLFFHARTADFQDITIQATVTYRVADPALAATRIDFGITPESGLWNATPLETLGGLLTELAQQPAVDEAGRMTMAEALARGIVPIRQRVTAALADDARLAERGLAVTDVRVVAISADPELERALQTNTREQVQQEADRATFERRALAVERERAIAENELQNQIALAKREEELVTQQGRNEREKATEKAAADQISVEAASRQIRLTAEAKADAKRAIGEAEAATDSAKLAAYQQLDAGMLLALSLKELAGNMPDIDTLTVTPDLVTSVLARLAAPNQLSIREET